MKENSNTVEKKPKEEWVVQHTLPNRKQRRAMETDAFRRLRKQQRKNKREQKRNGHIQD